jgi:hypothetical protein
MSYCLVSEDEMDASVDEGPRARRQISPSRSKHSRSLSHARLQPRPLQNDEDKPHELVELTQPSARTDLNTQRRESTQTVRPGFPGLGPPLSPTQLQLSSVLTPSFPDDSFGISDMSCSVSRYDSPVASFSEHPLTSVHDNDASDHQPGQQASLGEQELVMPLVTVPIPHRRPFTETGKSIGRLRILVAGGKGENRATLAHPPLTSLTRR